MPSRMDKYYTTNIKKRTDKNKELYRTMYDDVSYNNVEEISIIEKNEKIDIDKIRELINGTNNINKPKLKENHEPKPLTDEIEEQKNYDIRDILSKAKNERVVKDSKFSKTKYNALTDDNLNKDYQPNEEKIKGIMDAISSPMDDTLDLLDDLKSICDPELKEEIVEKIKDEPENNMDKSFYTSSIDFCNEDFEDEDSPTKSNNTLKKIILFILLILIVGGILFAIYYFKS